MVVVGVPVVLDDEPSARRAGAYRITEIERPDGQINDVRRHAGRPPAAVGHPRTVVSGVARQEAVVGDERPRPAPEVPIHPRGQGILLRRADARGRLVHYVERAHRADGAEVATANVLHDPAIIFRGVNLRADLADDTVLLHGVPHGKAFAEMERHRLLQVNVLARFARGNRQQTMPVRRRGDDHGVEVRLLEHLTEIQVAFAGGFVRLHRGFEPGIEHVARGGDDDIRLAGTDAEVDAAHAAAPDQPHVNAAVGRRLARGFGAAAERQMRRGEPEGGDRRGFLNEFAARRDVFVFHNDLSVWEFSEVEVASAQAVKASRSP